MLPNDPRVFGRVVSVATKFEPPLPTTPPKFTTFCLYVLAAHQGGHATTRLLEGFLEGSSKKKCF